MNPLSTIRQWAGRALVNGRVSKTPNSVILMANTLKMHFGIELGPEDRRIEQMYAARG